MEYSNVFPSSEVVGQPIVGEVLLYQYTAKYAQQLPFYDRNPMTYIVAMENNSFYGVNLHYTKPMNSSSLDHIFRSRLYSIRWFKNFKILCSMYVSATKGDDVDKALGMRLEQFVKDVGSIELPMTNQKIRRLLR